MKITKMKETNINQKLAILELIAELDENDCFIFISKNFEDTLGYTKEDLLYKNFKDIIHPEDLKLSQRKKIRGSESGNPYSHISSFRHKNGSFIYFEWRMNSYLDTKRQKKVVLISNPIPDFEQKKLVITSEAWTEKYNIFAVTDPMGRIIYANSSFCAISNYTSEELIGEDHRIVNSGFHSKEFFQEMYRTIQSGNIWRGEIRNRSKNGNIYWLDTILVPVTDREGRVDHYLGIRTDITEKKKLQDTNSSYNLKAKMKELEKVSFDLKEVDKNINEANLLLTTIIDNSFESIVFFDLDKKIQFYNQIASTRNLTLYGKPLQKGVSILNLGLPEKKESFDKHFYSALQGKRIIVDRPIQVNNADYWFELQYMPVKNEQSEVLGVLFIGRDINEKKQAEEELRRSENRFHTIFDQAPIGIAIIESYSGKFTEVNSQLCEILGYEESEIIGNYFLSSNKFEDSELSLKEWQNLLAQTDQLITLEKKYTKKNGESVWTEIKCVPIFGSEKDTSYHLLKISDITEFKQGNEELKKNMLQLESLNKTKDKFFSIIAHDLRNPFGGIIGLAEILDAKMKLAPKYESIEFYHRYIQLINTTAQSAYSLLENLLQWARTQTGEINVRPKKISINDLLSYAIPLVSGSAFKKNITIEKKIAANEILYADESLVSTILRNLLTNAIKFTNSNGKIIISTEKKERFLEISITDTGIGIESKDLEKLFRIDDKYSQIGTDNETGTGLGLILCKEFVEKLGGQIWVTSQFGIGTTFTFTLPLST